MAVLADRHEQRVLDAAPKLQDKLDAAHAKWVRDFWKRSPLAQKGGLLDTAQQQNADFRLKANAALTASEAATLKQVVNEMTGDVWSQALYDDLSVIAETGYISAGDVLQAAGLELHIDWNTVPAVTLDAIRQHCEQFAFMVNQREQQALFDVIDTALADGQTPAELAGVIKDTFANGYHVTQTTADGAETVKRIPTDSWSKMVARTELNRAQTMGNLAVFNAAQIEKVMYVTNGTGCEEICAPLDGEIYDLDEVEGMIPQHPACCCSWQAADEDVAYKEAA